MSPGRSLAALLLLVCPLGAAPESAAPRAPVLVAAWSFDSLEAGITPGFGFAAQAGKAEGRVVLAPGHKGNAASFSAAEPGRILIPVDLASYLDQEFTIEFWARPVKRGDAYGVCVETGATRLNQSAVIIRTNNLNRMTVTTGGTWNLIVPDERFTVGEWLHVAVTSDGKTVTLYLDGRQVSAKPLEKPVRFGSFIQVGGQFGPTRQPDGSTIQAFNYGFDGLIDDLRIYDGPLSAEAVAQSAR